MAHTPYTSTNRAESLESDEPTGALVSIPLDPMLGVRTPTAPAIATGKYFHALQCFRRFHDPITLMRACTHHR